MILPKNKFFIPNEKFISYMKENFLGRKVYDVGAGIGHVSKILYNNGIPCIAIDFCHRDDTEYQILELNAEYLPYDQDGVVMLCRPCHGDFVGNVIFQAIEYGVKDIIYVGLTTNLGLDLAEYIGDFQLMLRDVGEEGEILLYWRVN